jgi:hypothetical protein
VALWSCRGRIMSKEIAVIDLSVYDADVPGGDYTVFLNGAVGEGRWLELATMCGAGGGGRLIIVPADGQSARKLWNTINPDKPRASFVAEERRPDYIVSQGGQVETTWDDVVKRVSQEQFDKFWAPYEYAVVTKGLRPITKFTTMVEVIS